MEAPLDALPPSLSQKEGNGFANPFLEELDFSAIYKENKKRKLASTVEMWTSQSLVHDQVQSPLPEKLRQELWRTVLRHFLAEERRIAQLRSKYWTLHTKWEASLVAKPVSPRLTASLPAHSAHEPRCVLEGSVTAGDDSAQVPLGEGVSSASTAASGSSSELLSSAPPLARRKRRSRFGGKWDRNSSALKVNMAPRRPPRDWSQGAADCPLPYTLLQRSRTAFISTNGRVADEDVLQGLETSRVVEMAWTAQEAAIFLEQFRVHGKHFASIAVHLPGKTLPMVVAYYYRIKYISPEFQPIRAEVKERQRVE
eukprot:RCo047738